MIQTISIAPGITLRCFPDRRFKQGCLSVQFVRLMCREEAAMNALLPTVLLRGSASHPDMRAITLRLDELYGASVGTLVRRVGDYQTTGLYCGFIEDRFAMSGDEIFAPMVDFLRELLFSPVLQDGCFRSQFVESEKKNLISTIESELNDKRVYTNNQMLRRMCSADSFGIPRLGDKESVQAITPKKLYEHYLRVLKESRVDLFYVGSAPTETVIQALKPIFDGLRREEMTLAPQTPFRDGGESDTVEQMDVSQGKLAMGFATAVTTRDADFVPMQLFNVIFGGGMTSKLFMNVREKMSLAYSIGSAYHGSKGIVTVSAGIDSDQVDTVRREVLHQLNQCQTGCISAEELNCAKEALASGLRAVHDSPGSIENFYATAALSGLKLTPQAYMAAIENTTLEQVVAAANTVRLHTVYFLKGVRP